MTIGQLKDLLDELSNGNDAMEVRLMTQRQWPFEYSVSGAWTPEPVEADEDGELNEDAEAFEPAGAESCDVVYLVEGGQLGYGTTAAWEELVRA